MTRLKQVLEVLLLLMELVFSGLGILVLWRVYVIFLGPETPVK